VSVCYFLHTHINQAVIFQLASLTGGREMVCWPFDSSVLGFPLGNLLMSSFVRSVSQDKNDDRVFTLGIDVMCVCVSCFFSNHTANQTTC